MTLGVHLRFGVYQCLLGISCKSPSSQMWHVLNWICHLSTQQVIDLGTWDPSLPSTLCSCFSIPTLPAVNSTVFHRCSALFMPLPPSSHSSYAQSSWTTCGHTGLLPSLLGFPGQPAHCCPSTLGKAWFWQCPFLLDRLQGWLVINRSFALTENFLSRFIFDYTLT